MAQTTDTTTDAPPGGRWPTSAAPVGREASRALQRKKLVRAVIDVMAKRGFADTSVERICTQADVSFPTFRKHFGNKDECFLAAIDESVEGASTKVSAAVEAAGGDWATGISAGLAALLEFIAADPPRARVCLVESLTAGAGGIERYEAATRLAVPGIRKGREKRRSKTELTPVLEETVLGGVAWVLHQLVASGKAEQAPSLHPGLLESLLSPYLGAAKAKEIAAT